MAAGLMSMRDDIGRYRWVRARNADKQQLSPMSGISLLTLNEQLPLQRYLILNGDKTTANGTVVAAPTTIQFMGRDVAHEGDDVQCPACHTTGKIKCDGPRQVMSAPDGRHAALSDDLCTCKCDPSPKLVASQQSMSVDAR